MPLLSVITVTLNSARTLRETLASVAAQGLGHEIEHLVQDGGSTDETLAICRDFPDVRVVSEPDRGIYDAMNRGIARARGDVVAVLNSDDRYRPGALPQVTRALRDHPSWDGLFGDVVYIDAAGRTIMRRREAAFDYQVLRYGLCYVVHPTFFMRRQVLDQLGGYRADAFPLCADYDLFLRVARGGFCIGHLPAYLADFRVHGHGHTADRRVQRRMSEEARRLHREHGRPDGLIGSLLGAYAHVRRQTQKLVLRRSLDLIPGKLILRKHMLDRAAIASKALEADPPWFPRQPKGP